MATRVPIIGMSGQTSLTNLSGDQNAWAVYMTIGNIPSTMRNRPLSMGILLLGCLPMPPKLRKSSGADKLLRCINTDTLRGVLELILAPLNGVARKGTPIDCAEGKIRRCFQIMGGLWTLWKTLCYTGLNPMGALNVRCLQKNYKAKLATTMIAITEKMNATNTKTHPWILRPTMLLMLTT